VQGGHDQHDPRLWQGLPKGAGDSSLHCFARVLPTHGKTAATSLDCQRRRGSESHRRPLLQLVISRSVVSFLPASKPKQQVHALRDNYRSCARIVATAEQVSAAHLPGGKQGCALTCCRGCSISPPVQRCSPSQSWLLPLMRHHGAADLTATCTTHQQVIAANDDWERAGLNPKRPPGHPIEVNGAACLCQTCCLLLVVVASRR